MGGLARLKERFSQKAKTKAGTTESFKPTYKDRATVTYGEATKFAEQLKSCRKSIRTLRSATEGMLLQTERALASPLPRIYEYDPEQQKAAPTSDSIPAVAQSLTRVSGNSALSGAGHSQEHSGVRVSQLNPISATLSRRLENEVIHPMDQWLKLHADFKLKLKTLERRRLDYDADRRAFARLEAKRTKSINGGTNIKPEVTTQLQSKEHTMAAKKSAYDSYEQEIFEELSALVSDAGALHTFLEAALKLESSALLSAVGPGPNTILEGEQHLGASGRSQYAPSYGGEEAEEDVSYPAAPTNRLPTTATPLGANRPTAAAESNPAEGLKPAGDNNSSNVTHAPAKIDRAPGNVGHNAPQPIAA